MTSLYAVAAVYDVIVRITTSNRHLNYRRMHTVQYLSHLYIPCWRHSKHKFIKCKDQGIYNCERYCTCVYNLSVYCFSWCVQWRHRPRRQRTVTSSNGTWQYQSFGRVKRPRLQAQRLPHCACKQTSGFNYAKALVLSGAVWWRHSTLSPRSVAS